MSDKKEIRFIAWGLVAGAFITIFSDLFYNWLIILFPNKDAIPFVKTLSGVLGIFGGLIILKYYSKDSKKNEQNKNDENGKKNQQNKESNNRNRLNYSKKVDVLIAIVVISFIILAFLAYFGLFNDTHHYRLVTTRHPVNLTLSDGTNSIIYLRSIVSLHTQSLSAKSPIKVEMRLEPEQEDMKNNVYDWTELQMVHGALFDGAKIYPLKERGNGEYMDAVIQLNRYNDPPHYYGTRDIEYQFEGGNGYFYFTPEESKMNEDGSYTLENIKVENRTNNKTIFPVGSSEQTITLKNNNLILCLTFVFVSIGVIQIRGWLSKAK